MTVPVIQLRLRYRNHVWSYECMADRTSDGRRLKLLTIIDEHSRECLAIDVGRKLTSEEVMWRLPQLFIDRGPPAYQRCDNGGEFTATAVRKWLGRVGVARSTSSRAAPGRMAAANRPTPSSGMSCCAWSCSTRCWRHRDWRLATESTTIRHGRTAPWTTGRRRQRLFAHGRPSSKCRPRIRD